MPQLDNWEQQMQAVANIIDNYINQTEVTIGCILLG
jgi:hypothetical protein